LSLQELLEIAGADRQKTIWELIKDACPKHHDVRAGVATNLPLLHGWRQAKL